MCEHDWKRAGSTFWHCKRCGCNIISEDKPRTSTHRFPPEINYVMVKIHSRWHMHKGMDMDCNVELCRRVQDV